MKAIGGVVVNVHAFWASAVDEGEMQYFGRFAPGGRTRSGLGGEEKDNVPVGNRP